MTVKTSIIAAKGQKVLELKTHQSCNLARKKISRQIKASLCCLAPMPLPFPGIFQILTCDVFFQSIVLMAVAGLIP